MKSVRVWNFSGLYFPAFALNIWEIWNRKTPITDTFYTMNVSSVGTNLTRDQSSVPTSSAVIREPVTL